MFKLDFLNENTKLRFFFDIYTSVEIHTRSIYYVFRMF